MKVFLLIFAYTDAFANHLNWHQVKYMPFSKECPSGVIAHVRLSYDTNERVLKNAFDEFGEIIEVKVICDRVSGKSRGYGFVNYTSEEAAGKALMEMDDQLLDGRNIRIHYAHRGGRQRNHV
ncbi:hypothetical protein OROGR_024545 [Orobanche gracilis]